MAITAKKWKKGKKPGKTLPDSMFQMELDLDLMCSICITIELAHIFFYVCLN